MQCLHMILAVMDYYHYLWVMCCTLQSLKSLISVEVVKVCIMHALTKEVVYVHG